MKYIFLLMPIGLLIYLFYFYDQYWPNEVYLKEYEKIKEMKEHLGNRIVDGAPEPDMPDFYNNNTTLYGIDKNKNGVRDDVEIWINLNARSKLEKEMYVNYARSVFFYTKDDVEKTDKDELLWDFRRKYLKKIKANDCFYVVCEMINLKKNSKLNCIEQSTVLIKFLDNNKLRSFNYDQLNLELDFSSIGSTFNSCKHEYELRVKNEK
jgi:hypothetical protein